MLSWRESWGPSLRLSLWGRGQWSFSAQQMRRASGWVASAMSRRRVPKTDSRRLSSSEGGRTVLLQEALRDLRLSQVSSPMGRSTPPSEPRSHHLSASGGHFRPQLTFLSVPSPQLGTPRAHHTRCRPCPAGGRVGARPPVTGITRHLRTRRTQSRSSVSELRSRLVLPSSRFADEDTEDLGASPSLFQVTQPGCCQGLRAHSPPGQPL